MRKYSMLFLIVCITACRSKTVDNLEIRSFLTFYQKNVLKQPFLAVDETVHENLEHSNLWDILQVDSIRKMRFAIAPIKKWRKSSFYNVHLLDKEEQAKIFRTRQEAKSFKKRYGGLYTFSSPAL